MQKPKTKFKATPNSTITLTTFQKGFQRGRAPLAGVRGAEPRKRSVSSILTPCFIALWLTAFAFSALAHTAPIEVAGENPYKSIRLTPPIYNAANRNLSDLLLTDGAGEKVPYFIDSGQRQITENTEAHAMELLETMTVKRSFFFNYAIADPPSGDVIATSIAFATQSANFAKEVVLYGSYDNRHWELVQNDNLYVVDGKQKLHIDFAQPQKYTHYRLQLSNNLEEISFDTVTLVYNIERIETSHFIETFAPGYSVTNDDRQTIIAIEGLKHLRMCDISIETDSMFQRTVTAPSGIAKELYNLTFDQTSYADTTLQLQGHIVDDEIYVVTIANGDDAPIQIDGLRVRYYADEVVFKANAGDVITLAFGADERKTPPVYDIARYQDEIRKGPIDALALGQIQYETADETPPEDNPFVFHAIVIVVALVLGVVLVRNLRRK